MGDLLMECRAILSEGESEIAAEAFQEAVMSFRAGVELLGEDYCPPGYIDSTSTRLMLAGIDERKGNLKGAAQLLRNAFASRVSMYEEKIVPVATVKNQSK